MAYCVLLVAILVVLIVSLVFKSSKSNMPGPKPLPFLGNALQLDRIRPFLSLSALAEKYGGIFQLNLLNKVVVVSSPELINQVLVKQGSNFIGRTRSSRWQLLSNDYHNVLVAAPGSAHTAKKRSLNRFLQKLEHSTQTAADDLITTIMDSNNQAIDIRHHVFQTITNITAISLTGNPTPEEQVTVLKNAVENIMKYLDAGSNSGLILDMFPIVRLFGNEAYRQIKHTMDMMNRMISDWFDERPTAGFIHFIQSMTQEEQKQCFLYDRIDQVATSSDLFLGGIFTTSTTLSCVVNILCHHPHVQSKLREEVMDVIGIGRQPTLADQVHMPYLRATLMEVGRFASVVPIAVPHKCVKQSTLGGFTIPVGTEVWVNLWHLHHDEKLWDEPFVFKPERYLDADGQLVPADHPNRANTLPFSAGPRMCVADTFAVGRYFLIMARILQHFSILPESSMEQQPSCDPRDMIGGGVNTQKTFKVRFELF